MLKKMLKWAGIVVGGLVVLILLVGSGAYLMGSSRLAKTYLIRTTALEIPTDSLGIARGKHLAVSRMCAECHGENLGGTPFVEDALFGSIPAPNLTSGTGGIGSKMSDEQWVRAIRHGIGRDNRSLMIMPSEIYFHLDDVELGSLIAYLKQLPPVDNELSARNPGILPHFIVHTGDLLAVEKIPHTEKRGPVIQPGATVEYGAYLARMCIACHGSDYSGGIVLGEPGAPPSRNITPDPATGIGTWEKEDFYRVLRTAVRPDGTELSEAMPRSIGKMSDVELDALWLFLRSLEPRAAHLANSE